MDSYRTDTDPDHIEANCSKVLNTFVNKFHQHTNLVKKQFSELRKIRSLLSERSKQIEKLESMSLEDSEFHTEESRRDVTAAAINEANTEVQSIKWNCDQVAQSHEELCAEFKRLVAAANALGISSENSRLFTGTSKQKPLDYYVHGAASILKNWTTYLLLLQKSIHFLDVKELISNIGNLEMLLLASDKKISSLDDYLLFCSFLINKK